MSDAMSSILERMNQYYKDLNTKQADFMSLDPTLPLGMTAILCAS